MNQHNNTERFPQPTRMKRDKTDRTRSHTSKQAVIARKRARARKTAR